MSDMEVRDTRKKHLPNLQSLTRNGREKKLDDNSSAITSSQNQTSVPSERFGQALRHIPVAFVRAGHVEKRRKGKKRSSSTSDSSAGHHDEYLGDLDWTICDLDCGWCGHCYSSASIDV